MAAPATAIASLQDTKVRISSTFGGTTDQTLLTYYDTLVSRIGGSLFKLLDEVAPAAVPMNLIDAHVDAVRAIVRNKIQDANHPVGVTLVAELERRVRETITKAA